MYFNYNESDSDSESDSEYESEEIKEASFAVSKDLVYYSKKNLDKYYTYPTYNKIIDYFNPVIQTDSFYDNKNNIKPFELSEKHPDFIKYFGDRNLPVFIKKTELNKVLMLQPAQKACVPTSLAMVYYDKFADNSKSIRDNIENNINIKNVITQASNQSSCTLIDKIEKFGLDIKKTNITFLDVKDLLTSISNILKEHTSLLQSINSKDIQGHMIVVDKIIDKGVLIRDPYNGIMGILDSNIFIKSLNIEKYSNTVCKGYSELIDEDDEDFFDIVNNKKICKFIETIIV